MTKESAQTRIAYLDECQNEPNTKCLRRKTPLNHDSSQAHATIFGDIFPELEGKLFIENENYPATKEFEHCEKCIFNGEMAQKIAPESRE